MIQNPGWISSAPLRHLSMKTSYAATAGIKSLLFICIESPNRGFVNLCFSDWYSFKIQSWYTQMNKAICSLDNFLVIKYRVLTELPNCERIWDPKDSGCWEKISHHWDAQGMHRDQRSENAVWPGSVKSSLGWREITSHLEGEEHLKVLNCKAENLMQSLKLGCPLYTIQPYCCVPMGHWALLSTSRQQISGLIQQPIKEINLCIKQKKRLEVSYYMYFQEMWKKKAKKQNQDPALFSHKLTKTSSLFIVVLQFISWRHTAEDAKALATLLLN